MKLDAKFKSILNTKIFLVVLSLLGLILSFQNCAPAAIHSKEIASTDATATNDTPMSKVTVHLTHDSSVTLSDVEVVADDVADTIDRVPDGEAMGISKTSQTTVASQSTETAAGLGYNLELPTGLQKIIVARAKYRDPVSNRIATYYGNAVVTVNEALGDVSIQMVAIP